MSVIQGVTLTDIATWLTSAGMLALLGLLLRHHVAVTRIALEGQQNARDGLTILIDELHKDVQLVREQHNACEMRLATTDATMRAMQLQLMAITVGSGGEMTKEAKALLKQVTG